jgi:hypothetical protein
MTAVAMSSRMEAQVRATVRNLLIERMPREVDAAFSATQPMTTVTKSVTFEATGTEGTRQFTLQVSLTEAASVVHGNTTAGFSH